MEHEICPKQAILDKVGDLSGIEVFGTDVLLGIYLRPNRTKSGLYLSDNTVDEDRWQSKAALVLKLGNTAFKDENGEAFRDIAPGDWVIIRPSDGFPVQLSSTTATSSREAVPCRIVTDIHIRARISHPDTLY
jgi:co-chaperonin GroES (HSP10)